MRIGIDARRYGSIGRGQERYVRCLIHALVAAGREHEYSLLGAGGAGRAGDLGPRARFIPATRCLRLQHRRRFGALRRLLVRDLDLVHFPLADGWYSRVGRAVTTVHDLSVLRYPEVYFADAAAERRARQHFEAITANADAVIAVSEATGRDVISLLGVPEGRVKVVPHGVEPAFRPISDRRLLSEVGRRYRLPARYLLFVGGVDFKKNVARLVTGYALALERARLPHALVLAGMLQAPANPFFDTARATAARAHVSGRLRWLGQVPDVDLPALYAGADALVLPSLWEGFGLPVLEAMACGTPVVTSAGSAMEEVTGDAAVLVDPGEPEAIAEGILRVLDGEAERLARAGLRRAALYTWARTADETTAVYEHVAAGGALPERVAR
ncbi:glycosyltransferase family 4 protein [Gaiella occulta]|nr:glycosyltransferase family 1 protein [Gaiella occulta]